RGEYSVYMPGPTRPLRGKGLPSRPGPDGISEEGYMTVPSETRPTFCAISVMTLPPQLLDAYKAGLIDPSAANIFPGITMTGTKMTWFGRAAAEVTVDSDLTGMLAAFPGGNELGQAIKKDGLPGKLPAKNRYYMRWVVMNEKLYTFAIQNLYNPPSEAERKA